MKNPSDYIKTVGNIVQKLEVLGLLPILVGGMALVILGSQRVTRDFDFLISSKALDYKNLVKIFYKGGFELASKVDKHNNITHTIDNMTVATSRLRIDSPSSAYFFNKTIGLRIDLLFDFPLPAEELASRATIKKIRSFSFRIASKQDLIQLKKLAQKNRKLASDAQDLEFLRNS